jgi:hypothetical protein
MPATLQATRQYTQRSLACWMRSLVSTLETLLDRRQRFLLQDHTQAKLITFAV